MSMNILQKKIKEASQKYYTDGTSDVSDSEFDAMLDKLKEDDPNSPLLEVGHGYDVDEDSTPGERVKHKYGIAGSLDKCHNWSEIPSKIANDYSSNTIWTSLKLDGISVVLYYEKGVLKQALTRGGGTSGIDITSKVAYILGERKELRDRLFTGAVRGEILMSYRKFNEYVKEHSGAKNPRNTTAGIINSKEYTTDDLDFLDIVVYSVVGLELFRNYQMNKFLKYKDIWEFLDYNFKNHVAPYEINQITESNLMDIMEQLQKKWYGCYPADGVVISRNNTRIVDKDNNLFEVQYDSVAFKFKAESKVTRVIGIDWNLTKTKFLVPRINVETVELSGTNVSWATGFNAENVLNRKLGVGSEVRILKSGEIIPYIEEVVTPVECELPTSCPCCGSDLVWNRVHLMCPNQYCSDSDMKDVLVWMENISPWYGLGDTLKSAFLREMFDDKITVEAIYEHGMYDETKIGLPSIKKSEFRMMFNSLFTNKVKLSSALQALNIPRLSDVTSKKVARYPEVVKQLIDASETGEKIAVDYSEQFGAANFISILNNIHKFKRLNFIIDNILWDSDVEDTSKSKVKVAITGKLSVSRKVFEAELQAARYLVGDISKDTSYLITDDPNSKSDKNKKADKYGIPKITEADFRKLHMK